VASLMLTTQAAIAQRANRKNRGAGAGEP
jgi:hypothetical protein